jgi:hypothetical protein
MTSRPDFQELVGEDLAPEEEQRLRRAHELLLQADAPEEVPPALAEPSIEGPGGQARDGIGVFQLLPRRRVGAALALAAAIAVVAFLGGYLAGYNRNGFTAQVTVPMHAVAGGQGAADIKVGKRDAQGNWPLELELRNLPRLNGGAYYEMFLTRGKLRWTCGTFAGGGAKTLNVRLTVPYNLKRGDGWIVVAEQPGEPQPGRTVLTT